MVTMWAEGSSLLTRPFLASGGTNGNLFAYKLDGVLK